MLSPHTLFVNALTFSRVPLIFAYLAAAVWGHFAASVALKVVACLFMLLAGLSDLYDGKLARRWNVVSNFGKMADPLMDKVFFIVVFPSLVWLASIRGDNAAHATILLIFAIFWILRDQWVTFLRAVASAYGANVAAMWLGKVRTALSFPSAGVIYMFLAFGDFLPPGLRTAALYAVYAIELFLMGLNVHSFAVYTRVYLPYMRKALAPTPDVRHRDKPL